MGLTACSLRRKTMYKTTDYEYEQLSFINFNMACGMQLDMNNDWIRIAVSDGLTQLYFAGEF
mgnify:CR=1 FL=1